MEQERRRRTCGMRKRRREKEKEEEEVKMNQPERTGVSGGLITLIKISAMVK